jgi:type II secretory pathway pseudopilin PulG
MMVVILVMAIIFSIAMPRFSGQEERQLELAAQQVADLFTMFLQRENLGSKPVAIVYDEPLHQMAMFVLDIDEYNPEEPAAWYIDRTARPVKLPDSTYLLETRIDGLSTGEPSWRFIHTPGQERMPLEVVLAGGGETRTIVMPVAGISCRILDGGGGAARVSVDLDAAGRSREEW